MVIEESLENAVNHTPPPRRAHIGTPANFWIHTTKHGFDLTHPSSVEQPYCGSRLRLETTTSPITIDPSKTALVIVDMQNFFLSPTFQRPTGPGHAATDNLLRFAIPAARKAGIQIIWLNWGLTEEDLKSMPPAVARAFGFQSIEDGHAPEPEPFREKPHAYSTDKHGSTKVRPGKTHRGLGTWCGNLTLPDGDSVDAGKLLMRDSWNAQLYAPLAEEYEQGLKTLKVPDVLIHKNRMSGLWGASTPMDDFLEQNGIRSLLFTGVNTDQCVNGTLTDAFSKGYDAILLDDGCGTSSPEFAQQTVVYNVAHTHGFVTSCERFANGVDLMKEREEEFVMVTEAPVDL